MTSPTAPPAYPSALSSRAEEYLTVAELAGRLKLSPKTVRNRMHDGTWQRGVHWFSRRGIAPRFRWSAVEAWLLAPEELEADQDGAAFASDLPPARRGRPRRPQIALSTP